MAAKKKSGKSARKKQVKKKSASGKPASKATQKATKRKPSQPKYHNDFQPTPTQKESLGLSAERAAIIALALIAIVMLGVALKSGALSATILNYQSADTLEIPTSELRPCCTMNNEYRVEVTCYALEKYSCDHCMARCEKSPVRPIERVISIG